MRTQDRNLRLAAVLAGAFALASVSISCTDPVRDRAIEVLGEEDPGVPPGPVHRPGQPCVVCHSKGGPASDFPFAIAGTIFETSLPDSRGADETEVLFVDANNAKLNAFTNASGNFYVRESEWDDLAYPFKTGVKKKGAREILMTSTINREGSCNFCHKPHRDSRYSLPTDDPRESVGPIFATVQAAGGTP